MKYYLVACLFKAIIIRMNEKWEVDAARFTRFPGSPFFHKNDFILGKKKIGANIHRGDQILNGFHLSFIHVSGWFYTLQTLWDI